MSINSKIEWTENTWNPVTGCTKISQGCKHCYAERMSKRLQGIFTKYSDGFSVVTTHPDELDSPILRQAKSKMIFVCSMSDLFHKDVPDAYIIRVFEAMNKYDQHTYQVLTKRSDRVKDLSPKLPWAKNIWMGVTVEDKDNMGRIDHLRATSAHLKFLSLEPLLGPLPKLDLTGIDWVIVGGESGSNERLLKPEWIQPIRDNCIRNKVPFFFKQWGGYHKKANGRQLDGRTWDEMPMTTSCLAE